MVYWIYDSSSSNENEKILKDVVTILDVLVIVILIVFILIGIKRGCIVALFDFISFFLSILISKMLYPIVSKGMAGNPLVFNPIHEKVMLSIKGLKIEQQLSLKMQNELLNQLPFPKFLIELLRENNNPEIYKLLKVSTLEQYIGSLVTTMIIHMIAMLLVFVLSFVAIKIIGISVNLVSRLPVIHTFNSVAGGAIGFLQGVLVVWIVLVVLTLFVANPGVASLLTTVDHSTVAVFFYDHNLILDLISQWR